MKYCTCILLLFFASTLSFAQNKVDKEQLLKHLQILSADSMEGRGFGTEGSKKAKAYIENEFNKLGLKPAFDDSYEQQFDYTHRGTENTGFNVVAVIPGSSKRSIVVTAHYDHLGIRNGHIYNGADDNASGTAALFEIGRHFQKEKPNHTILLAAVDAEEIGSGGAQHLLDNFPLEKDEILLNVNLDMIAHNDKNELYVCGTYHYPRLKQPLTELETSVDLKFGHDSPEYVGADNWTYASDHRVFHRKKIPFLYFGVEDHEDYHKPSDDYEKINADFYANTVDTIIKVISSLDKNFLSE